VSVVFLGGEEWFEDTSEGFSGSCDASIRDGETAQRSETPLLFASEGQAAVEIRNCPP